LNATDRGVPAQPQHRQRHQVLGEHPLLGAEPAAHAFGEDVLLVGMQPEDVAQLVAHQKRHLRARANHQPPPVIPPTGAAVRLQVRVLYPLSAPPSPHDRAAV
jgi:hypothetical protein